MLRPNSRCFFIRNPTNPRGSLVLLIVFWLLAGGKFDENAWNIIYLFLWYTSDNLIILHHFYYTFYMYIIIKHGEASCGPSSDSGASLARREGCGDAGQ